MSSPEDESSVPSPTAEGSATFAAADEMTTDSPVPADETDIRDVPEEEGDDNDDDEEDDEDDDDDDDEAETVIAEDVEIEETDTAERKDTPADPAEETMAPPADSEDPAAEPSTDDPAEKSDDAASKSEAEQAAEDSVASKELPYSTRGRTTDKETSSVEDKWSSSIDALEDIGNVKNSSPATLGVSFLESLTEEERRTRTRFIPDVEGMHALRKHEVKDDLSLARSLVSSSGVMSLKKSKKRTEDMDVDEEGGASPSEDGSTDASRPRPKVVELPTRTLNVPSVAFISSDEDVQTTSISALKTQNGVKSPLLVETVTGFNPPRPPESVGAKKKHRMLRWERRPEDVEVDLNNYKKTVQRTRQELHKAEAEYHRLETMDAHLRWNFLSHLNLINEEFTRLNEEISSVQQECVKAADLLTSRTRSRGAGKSSYVMKDVLSVLKQRGAENVASGETQHPIIENPLAGPGLGGLAPSVFGDWDRRTSIAQTELACAWTVPGDKVKTPFGEGVVIELYPPLPPLELSQSNKKDEKTEKISDKAEEQKEGIEARDNREDIEPGDDKPKSEGGEVKEKNEPCVSVKVSAGIKDIPITQIKPVENPCLFSDARLAHRWSKMVKTAVLVGGTIDPEGMNFNSKTRAPASQNGDAESKMDVEAPSNRTEESASGDQVPAEDEDHFMPFGSDLLPTASGRGNLLHMMSFEELERSMEDALYNGQGVLGKVRY